MSEIVSRSITRASALLGLLIGTIGMLPGLAAYCFNRLRTGKFERNVDLNYVYGELTGKFIYRYAAQGSVEFRTNGMQGGDAGHGGYLEIEYDTRGHCTDLYVSIDGSEPKQVDTVSMTWRGDEEMRGAIDSLAFLSNNLIPRHS